MGQPYVCQTLLHILVHPYILAGGAAYKTIPKILPIFGIQKDAVKTQFPQQRTGTPNKLLVVIGRPVKMSKPNIAVYLTVFFPNDTKYTVDILSDFKRIAHD